MNPAPVLPEAPTTEKAEPKTTNRFSSEVAAALRKEILRKRQLILRWRRRGVICGFRARYPPAPAPRAFRDRLSWRRDRSRSKRRIGRTLQVGSTLWTAR